MGMPWRRRRPDGGGGPTKRRAPSPDPLAPPSGPPQKAQRSIDSFFGRPVPKAPFSSVEGAGAKQARTSGGRDGERGGRGVPASPVLPLDATATLAALTPELSAPVPGDAVSAGKASGSGGGGPATTTPAPPTAGRDPALHARWQRKVAADDARREAAASGAVASGCADGGTGVPKPTPLEQQVAALQASNPDTVLAIEVGYKFQFFGRDAEVAAAVLRVFAYVDRAQLKASVPVPGLPKAVRRLVAAGHRVGIVRQIETAALKKAGATADGRGGPFARKLTAIYTAATTGPEEDVGTPAGLPAPGDAGSEPAGTYLLAVAAGQAVGGGGEAEVGLAAVDAASGDVRWASLPPAGLPGVLVRLQPAEVVLARPLQADVVRLLDAYAAESPAVRLEEDDGGSGAAGKQAVRAGAAAAAAPTSPTCPASPSSHHLVTAARAELAAFFAASPGGAADAAHLPPQAARALAAAARRLRAAGLDAPLRALGAGATLAELDTPDTLRLHAGALTSLDVLASSDGGARTLLWLLNRCRTRGGGRLLRTWISRPLGQVAAIEERLDAVQELVAAYEGTAGVAPILTRLASALAGTPDVERGLARALHRTASPAEFVSTMQTLLGLPAKLGIGVLEGGVAAGGASSALPGVSSTLLIRLVAAAAAAPACHAAAAALAPLDTAAAAGSNRVALLACAAAFPRTASGKDAVAAADSALQGLLPALRAEARAPGLQYVHVHNQGDYLVELPAGAAPPRAWVKVSGTKKVDRYAAPAVTKALADLNVARERLAAAAAAEWAGHLGGVAAAYACLRAAATSMAQLDALLSLAEAAASHGWTRPRFVPFDPAVGPVLRLTGFVHPMLAAGTARAGGGVGGAAVPNDCSLGGGEGGGGCGGVGGSQGLDGADPAASSPPTTTPRALVITGPNMGGKSCTTRAIALAVVMAHAGSFVAAEAAQMTPFDSVGVRMGASDNLLLGRSTFLEELSEMSTILATSSHRSLVVADELGRGTSTHDGSAIAYATLRHLATATRCITLFVTHHPVVADLARELPGDVAAAHMACVEGGAGDGADPPRITFLYKLASGMAKQSFGLNVARLAGLPDELVARAAQRSNALEAELVARRAVAGAPGPLVAAVSEAAGEGRVDRLAALQVAVRAVLL